MDARPSLAAVCLLALAACGSPAASSATDAPAVPAQQAAAGPFTLTSPDIKEGATIALAQVYNAMGCTGQNVSPALGWTGAPPATKSFSLTIHDPDAPHPGGFWHWLAYDIPAVTTGLARGAGAKGSTAMPTGVKEGRNDFGDDSYDGPCPPVGSAPHHYNLVLSALDVSSLGIPAGAPAAQVSFAIQAHTIASAKLTGLYGR